MKYVIMSVLALTVAIGSVNAQARPGKAKKQKKQIGKHPNGKPPSATVFLHKGNLIYS